MNNVDPKIEVGKEISANCTKCKVETVHVITKIVDGAIKKVYCKICNSTHSYRDNNTEKKSSRSRSSSKAPTNKTKRSRKNISWGELVSVIDDNQIQNYDFTKDYTQSKAIQHKKFGVGVIVEVIDKNKIEVVFQDEKRILAHNWST